MLRRCPKCKELKEWHPDNGGEYYIRRRPRLMGPDSDLRVELEKEASGYCRKCNNVVRKDSRKKTALVKVVEEIETGEKVIRPRSTLQGPCEICGETVPDLGMVVPGSLPLDVMERWPHSDSSRGLVEPKPKSLTACWRCTFLLGTWKDTRSRWAERIIPRWRFTPRGKEKVLQLLQILLEHNAREVKKEREAWKKWEKLPRGAKVRPFKREVHDKNQLGKVKGHEVCMDVEERLKLVLKWMLRPGK